MQRFSPAELDLNTLNAIDSIFAAHTLDDLFETTLSNLLDIEHVQKAEILLFNKKKKLVSVATASNSGPPQHKRKAVRTESAVLESSVEHTTRRIRMPRMASVFSIPVMDSGQLQGFLYIHLDKLLIPSQQYLGNFYLVGIQLAAKIKEIMLKKEIEETKAELQNLAGINNEIQQRVTSLSKELFAISAISAKINQSMDFDESLLKSMATTRQVFKAACIMVYTRRSGSFELELAASDCPGRNLGPALLKKIKKDYLKEVISLGKPLVKHLTTKFQHQDQRYAFEAEYKTAVGVPLRSKEATLGAIFLLHSAEDPVDQAGLRLLSGMANIMAMAIENKNLYRQSLQKKNEAAFLFQSIVKFNQKLDLAETLKSVAEKGAEFTGWNCRVYLFTETKVPLILSTHANQGQKCVIESQSFDKIRTKELKNIYQLLLSKNQSMLIKHINRSKKIAPDTKQHFRDQNIYSLIGVPLRVRKRKLGLLLVARGKNEKHFDHHELAFVEALGSAASLAIENARAYTASQEMSDFLEKKITEKTSQIQHLQERQKIRVENRKDIIFRVNNRNRYVFVNKAMELLTGLSKEELYHEDFPADQVVAEEDRKQVNYYFKKIMRKELPLAKDIEYRQLNRKGDDHLISLTIYPEMDEFGRILGVEGVGRDITEKKRLEAELKKAKDLALLGEFSSAVAHQIRNPLGNILMGTKLLQKALLKEHLPPASATRAKDGLKRGDQALADIFGNLSEGIQNLNRVVTELLEYTKTLKPSLSQQRIDVLLDETLTIFDDQISRDGIRVEKCYERGLPALALDAVLITQVFQNVIHNAIQVMPEGGCLSVASGFSRQIPGYASIEISDTGSGIKASEIDKIFRPFFTAKDSGTGLGLALAHRIVEAHQGSIWASNNPAGGAAIHILLPLNAAAGSRRSEV